MPADPATALSTMVGPCGVLASKHPHNRDARLHFEPDGHKYFWDGRAVSVSVACMQIKRALLRAYVSLQESCVLEIKVTGLIHSYGEEFDPNIAIEKMKRGSRWPRAEYVMPDWDPKVLALMLADISDPRAETLKSMLSAQKPSPDELCAQLQLLKETLSNWDDILAEIVLPDAEIKSMWTIGSLKASTSGTWMRAMFEYCLNGFDVCPGPMQHEFQIFLKFLAKHEYAQVWRTEWMIHAHREDLAGSIDLVLRDPEDGGLMLVDWKRSEKLPRKYETFGVPMRAPLDHVPDCQGYHYRLQLNIYKWILETSYEHKVTKMFVVCAHPAMGDECFVDQVTPMNAEVEELMAARRHHVLAQAGPESTLEPPATIDMKEEEEDGEEQDMGPADAVRPPHAVDNLNDTGMSQDVQDALNQIIEGSEEAVPDAIKDRQNMKGAADSASRFQLMFTKADALLGTGLEGLVADRMERDERVLHVTDRQLRELRQRYPDWSDELHRLTLVAAHMSCSRLSDKLMLPDSASLLWMMEGERHIRVHQGFCYVYDEDGTFLPFTGTPPELVLRRVANFCICLEGLFRSLPGGTRREAASIVDAVSAKRQTYTSEDLFLKTCREAAFKATNAGDRTARLDTASEGDDEDMDTAAKDTGSEESWTQGLAKRAWQVSCAIRSELMHTRLISLLVEWCETPPRRESCVCYDDLCVAYGRTPGQSLTIIKKSPSNNCYLKIPHPLLDPVLQANMDRLQKFYRETFWCNIDVFRCCQAALALAKHGLNVDRCFFGQSPGGVGQSLYSQHLSVMLGDNHAFFDPNIWHNEEELRKQVETFARCCVITGQEAPESSKKLHVDLFKKTMSGDGVSGRKPYGYSTRMFYMVGWKRIELNRMMFFLGVSLEIFNSMLRRGFFWRPKARFLHPKYLENFPDHENYGIFPSDPSLSKFLSTSQSAIAGLRLQHAFELEHDRDTCYQLIEDYVNGGDDYLTEDAMRKACGLPVRQRYTEVDGGLGALAAEAAADTIKKEKKEPWDNLMEGIVQNLLDANMEYLSFHEFKKMTFGNRDIPNLSKNELWDYILERDLMQKGAVPHRTGKQRRGNMLPKLKFEKSMGDFINTSQSTKLTFQEQHDVRALMQYADKHGARAKNVMIVKGYLAGDGKSCAIRKKGRPAKGVQVNKEIVDQRVEKLEAYENFLEFFRGSETPPPEKRRRMTGKSEAAPSTALDSNGMLNVEVTYHYSNDIPVRSRRYARKGSAQTAPRRVQHRTLREHTVDLDIKNCCFVLLRQILNKLQPTPPLPSDLQGLLDSCALQRDEFITKSLNMSVAEGKRILNAIINDGAIPPEMETHPELLKVKRLGIYCRWVACNLFPEHFEKCVMDKSRRHPSASVLHLLWTSVEDAIIDAWLEYILPASPKHVSLHFDGVRVDKTTFHGVTDFIAECVKSIKAKTGFQVEIAVKTSQTVVQMLRANATTNVTLKSVPDVLLLQGNCIPCSMWHCYNKKRVEIATGFGDLARTENVEAKTSGVRSYSSCAKIIGMSMTCTLGLPPPHVKQYLLHLENDGHPHCVTVQINASGDHVSLLDGKTHYRLKLQDFMQSIRCGVDEPTIATFWEVEPGKDVEPDIGLLELLAGMDGQVSDSEGSNGEEAASASQVSMIVDESDGFVFPDQVLDDLKQEVTCFLDHLKTGQKLAKQNDKIRCPLCPFRAFGKRTALRTHVVKHHSAKQQYVCSGTKQIKVIAAIHDYHAGLQQRITDYLRVSSEIMASTILPALPSSNNYIDKNIRVLFRATGPEYINEAALRDNAQARRVRNVYYDRSFADALLQDVLMQNAQDAWLYYI